MTNGVIADMGCSLGYIQKGSTDKTVFEPGLNTVQCKHVSKHHMVTYMLPDKINLIQGVLRDKGHHACICHWCLYVANTEKSMGIDFKIKQLPA